MLNAASGARVRSQPSRSRKTAPATSARAPKRFEPPTMPWSRPAGSRDQKPGNRFEHVRPGGAGERTTHRVPVDLDHRRCIGRYADRTHAARRTLALDHHLPIAAGRLRIRPAALPSFASRPNKCARLNHVLVSPSPYCAVVWIEASSRCGSCLLITYGAETWAALILVLMDVRELLI